MLRTVSLFSGAGGMDYGFEKAGYNIVFASEIDSDSAETWRLNRPKNKSVMHEGDIAQQLNYLGKLNDVEALIGGPPCQGFSVAGKMSANDTRNKLVDTYLEAVKCVRPKVFLMENVAALANSRRWENVREGIIKKASEIGYAVSFRIYDASDYGVPEHRERMLLVGVKNVFGEPDAFHNEMAKRKEEPRDLRSVLRDVGEYGSEKNPATCKAKITVAKNPVIRGHAYSGMLVNGAGRPMNLSRPAPTLTASMGGNNTPIIDDMNLADEKRRHWFEELYSVLSSTESCECEVPAHIRRLSLREAAAIQTFPEGYIFSGAVCSQYRQIGNAVPCRLAELAAAALKTAYFADYEQLNDSDVKPYKPDTLFQTRGVA